MVRHGRGRLAYFLCLHGPQDRGTRLRFLVIRCAASGDAAPCDECAEGGVGVMLAGQNRGLQAVEDRDGVDSDCSRYIWLQGQQWGKDAQSGVTAEGRKRIATQVTNKPLWQKK